MIDNFYCEISALGSLMASSQFAFCLIIFCHYIFCLCAKILTASTGEKRIVYIIPIFVPRLVLWNVLYWGKYFSFSRWTISLLKFQIYWETYKYLNILNPVLFGKWTIKVGSYNLRDTGRWCYVKNPFTVRLYGFS